MANGVGRFLVWSLCGWFFPFLGFEAEKKRILKQSRRGMAGGVGWLLVVGWWLVVGGWWLVVGGWWLVVGGWWLVVFLVGWCGWWVGGGLF